MSRKFIPKIKYINNAFDALEPLGLYTGKQIRNLYIGAELINYKNSKKYSHRVLDMVIEKGYAISGWDSNKPEEEIKDLTKRGLRMLHFRPRKFRSHKIVNSYYTDNSKTRELSLTPISGSKGGERVETMSHIRVQQDLKNISHKKYAEDSDNFLYFVVPHSIIDKHMTSRVLKYPGTKNVITSEYSCDYARLRTFVNEVELSEYGWCPTNFIPIMDRYDDKWDEVYYFGERLLEKGLVNKFKPERIMKWRHTFFPTQYISLKEYGLLWPVINKGATPSGIDNHLFHSGSHRLLTMALSKNDIPILVKISTESIDKGKCVLWIPQFFNGDYLTFEIFLNDKTVIARKQRELYKHKNKFDRIKLNDFSIKSDDSNIVDEFTYE